MQQICVHTHTGFVSYTCVMCVCVFSQITLQTVMYIQHSLEPQTLGDMNWDYNEGKVHVHKKKILQHHFVSYHLFKH